MSYVRIKVGISKLIALFLFLYLILEARWYSGTMEAVTPFALLVFGLFALTAFYMYNIKCENCGVIWYKAGLPNVDDPESLLDVDDVYLNVKKLELMASSKIILDKTCPNCGVKRY